jgi:hypothetical protein
MKPHILLLTSSNRNFPLDMQDILSGAQLENSRFATLADFNASPMRQLPFLGILEIGNTEDIDRALLAFEWAEYIQPLAPARFLLLIGSRQLSLGNKAARFRGAEVAQLPLPARNILFKIDLQLKVLSKPKTKLPVARGLVPLGSGAPEKERVIVSKAPGPAEGRWQAGESSPQGKVRWRRIDTQPKIAAALAGVEESDSPPKSEEADEVRGTNEPGPDLKYSREKEEIFSTLADEAIPDKKVLGAEVNEVSGEVVPARENQAMAPGEGVEGQAEEGSLFEPESEKAGERILARPEEILGVSEQAEDGSHFELGSEKAGKRISARVDEIAGMDSRGAANLLNEKSDSDFSRGPKSFEEKPKETVGDPAELPPVNQAYSPPSSVSSHSLKQKAGESPREEERFDLIRQPENSSRERREPTSGSAVESMFHARTEKLHSEVASPSGQGSSPVSSGENTLAAEGAKEGLEYGSGPELEPIPTHSPKKSLLDQIRLEPALERSPEEPIARPELPGAAPRPEFYPEKTSATDQADRGAREEFLSRATESDESVAKQDFVHDANSAGLTVTLNELSETSSSLSSVIASRAPSTPESPRIEIDPNSPPPTPELSEGERIVFGGGSLPLDPSMASPLGRAEEAQARRFVSEASPAGQKSHNHDLKMRHFLIMTLEELQDKNSSWYPIDGYRIYLSAQHRYYGFSKPEEIFPLWIYEGELAPEFLDPQNAWKFYDRLPTSHASLATLPDAIRRYLAVALGAQQLVDAPPPIAAPPEAEGVDQERSSPEVLLLRQAKRLPRKRPPRKRSWREKIQRLIRKALGMKDD